MKTFYSSDVIEVTVNFSGFSTGNYTYEVQEYAPINPDSPEQFVLNWTTIYTGNCFLVNTNPNNPLSKSFNITDIVESRKEYYDNIVTKDGKRVNLLNQYRVVINPTASNPTISETAQVVFFEQYPNYKSEMNPLVIGSDDLLVEDDTFYPIVTPLIQGVGNAQDTDDYESIPVLAPRLPLNNYTYPLVSLATPAYQYEPFKITTEGMYAFGNYFGTISDMEKNKLSPTFVTSIPMSLTYRLYDTIPINPTNYFTVIDYDGITEEFSHEEYRNFNWSPTNPTIYNVSFYLTDGTTEVPILFGQCGPGQNILFRESLLSNNREEFIRNNNNVELVLKLEGNDETKYVSFDCSWFNEKYQKVDDEQVLIWFTININYDGFININFGRGMVNQFSQIRKRRSGENSIWAETWFTYPNYDTNIYNYAIWEVVAQPSVGEYEIRNINPLDVTLFEFRLQVIVGGTIEQDFRIFNPVNKFEQVVFDTSKPEFANILERINMWYPEAEIVLRVASVDPPIVNEGWMQVEITSLLRNLESYNGIYIQFTSGTDTEDTEGKIHATLKFRNKDTTERCKIADIDTPQCNEIKRYYLMWQDRFGGFQCQPFEKTDTYQEEFKRHEWSTYQNAKRLGGIEIQPKWKLNTGFIDDKYYPYYESILISPYIMLIDTVEDKTYRVLVNDSNYTEKTFKNQGRQLFNLQLTVSQDKPQQILY